MSGQSENGINGKVETEFVERALFLNRNLTLTHHYEKVEKRNKN